MVETGRESKSKVVVARVSFSSTRPRTWRKRSRALAYQALPFLACNIKKNWEWPGDETKGSEGGKS